MRKKILILCLCLSSLFLVACSKDKYEIVLPSDEIDLYISETIEIEYDLLNNDEITQKQSVVLSIVNDNGVISVSGEEITGLKEGSAEVVIKLVDHPDTTAEVTINVIPSIKINKPLSTTLFIGEEITLTAKDYIDYTKKGISWSVNNDNATIDQNGKIKGVKEGYVVVTATSKTNQQTATLELLIKKIEITNMTIEENVQEIDVTDSFQLNCKIEPSTVSQDIIWESSDESIATIDSDGKVTTLKPGVVIFSATSSFDSSKQATISVTINLNPIKIMESLHVENPIREWVKTFGYNPDVREQWVNGSVNMYFNTDLNLIEKIVPVNTNEYTGQVATEEIITAAEALKKVRSGIIHPETKYIVYHDTGNHTPGANAKMHADYMVSSDNANNRARSWHYTVDENQVYHHIPDNEVTWQGDSYEAYAKSIGVETCVDYGSDLYATWQRTGKLMAKLLIENSLSISDIKQHYDFNGKNCPQTLRMNNLYGEAIELVKAEYLVATLLKDYEISFTSLAPEIVDDRGRVINAPETATRVSYIINITGDDYNESTILYSVIAGTDGTTTVTLDGNEQDFSKAVAFDLNVSQFNRTLTINDQEEIENLRSQYEALTTTQQKLVTTLPLLESLEYQILSFSKVNTQVIINEIMLTENNITSYGYIELYNPTNQDISLKGWTIQYAQKNSNFDVSSDKQDILWFAFSDQAIIKANSYYLIQVAGNNINGKYLPLPDAVTNINLIKEGGKIALVNGKNAITTPSEAIDFVGYNDTDTFESKKVLITDCIQRNNFIDTNNNYKDFLKKSLSPVNSLQENFILNQDESYQRVMEVDLLILNLPQELTLSDESKVVEARNKYNLLDTEDKDKVKKLDLLEDKENEILALKNPDLIVIYDALKNIPDKIVDDFTFPEKEGLTWQFKEAEGNEYFDLATGTYLKLSFAYMPFTIIAKYNQTEIEKIINFGILEKDQKAIFSTGATAPANGKTSDGFGTETTQKNTAGFGGVYIVVNNNVYFVGKNAYIELNEPANGQTLTIEELRPFGSSSPLYNQSLVNGKPEGYKGTGTLYYNNTNTILNFDPSFTYGRSDASYAGYGKVVFSPNPDGTYLIQTKWSNSGTNDETNNRIESLKPGEYLYCPHTYETNLNGGTWLMQEGTGGAVGVLVPGGTLSIGFYKYDFD